jgi:RNA polymerase sigma-70 factor (ECF subfamily)
MANSLFRMEEPFEAGTCHDDVCPADGSLSTRLQCMEDREPAQRPKGQMLTACPAHNSEIGGERAMSLRGGGRSTVVADMDSDAFAALVGRHRRELHVHCYRMLGSFHEAEDLVQETFLRAWDKRASFSGTGLRAWLYRIATNACIDTIRRSSRRVPALNSFAEVPWLEPYPDQLLDEVPSSDAEPDAAVVARETIELGFLAVIQLLAPRQRAVLILRDILGWPADETATALDMSVPAANSALQRARATLAERLPERRQEWSAAEPTAEERDLLARYIDAHERQDVAASVALVREDIRITMPPHPWCFDGVDAMLENLKVAFGPGAPGDWRLVPTRANRMPTAASYLRARDDTVYRAFKFDVLRIVDGVIAEVTTFDASLFPAFGLPPTLDWSPSYPL